MTTVKIDIPDSQAAALSAQAAAQGLTLETLVQKMVEQEAGRAKARSQPGQHGSVVEAMRKLRASVKPDPDGWTTRDYVKHGRR